MIERKETDVMRVKLPLFVPHNHEEARVDDDVLLIIVQIFTRIERCLNS
jgi:hypothetical protein